MCGIVGFVDPRRSTRAEDLRSIIEPMCLALAHRGPDDGGSWVDPASGIALGHRRLSIIDLSVEGHQPMRSADNRFVIVFNGEIYNFVDLRTELSTLGHRFRGYSDTEVLLAACSEWGFAEALKKCVGMFALALWDQLERTLYLARDRMGEKPLYYGWQRGVFMFGSELKALRVHPAFSGEIDRCAVAMLMRYSYVPTPYSIYRGIHKAPPGAFVRMNFQNVTAEHTPIMRHYWSARHAAETGAQNPFKGSDTDAIDLLDSALRKSVALQSVADVPLGAFLSGGVDSSTIVAAMQAQSTRPVKTFSIGFEESDYNEAHHAKAVATHLGTEHTELYVTAREAMAVIPSLPQLYDEPFADSSQIPTYLVARLARQHVTVSLSGDGGDELFYGYSRYAAAARAWNTIRSIPRPAQAGIKSVISYAPASLLNTTLRLSTPTVRRRRRSRREWSEVAATLLEPTGDIFYRMFVSEWLDPSSLMKGTSEHPDVFTDQLRRAELPSLAQRMMYLDSISYLPDDVLVKVDRAGMSVSLETRMPLLDHRLVELAWQFPPELKSRDGRGKWVLRQVLYRYVPQALVDRPKMGFGLPIGIWLRGPLRDWAESLLDQARLRDEGYFDPRLVRQTWEAHLSGRLDQHSLLWNVLMFQSWLTAAAATPPVVEPEVAHL